MNTRRVAVHVLVTILAGLLLMRCGSGGSSGPTVRLDTISDCSFSTCTCTKRTCAQTWTCPTKTVTTRDGATVVTTAVNSCNFDDCGACNPV